MRLSASLHKDMYSETMMGGKRKRLLHNLAAVAAAAAYSNLHLLTVIFNEKPRKGMFSDKFIFILYQFISIRQRRRRLDKREKFFFSFKN